MMYTGAGNAPSNAIYNSATYGQGTGTCTLTVSGSGGGFIAVSDSTYRALYVQPPAFGVLLSEELIVPYSPPTPPVPYYYQIYDVNSGTIVQTTTSFDVPPFAFALLPTINSILNYNHPSEEYNPRTSTWTLTGTPSPTRAASGLITLYDGTVLAVGGRDAYDDYDDISVNTCEIYSPTTGNWTITGAMEEPREQVLLTGGPCCMCFCMWETRGSDTGCLWWTGCAGAPAERQCADSRRL